MAGVTKNWGACEAQGCNLRYGPRCNVNLCISCCEKQHCYWLGHLMADGTENSVTKKAEQRVGYTPLPSHYGGTSNHSTEPPKPKVPEPGKMEELNDENTLLSTPDNSYAKGGKSGFPVQYIK